MTARNPNAPLQLGQTPDYAAMGRALSGGTGPFGTGVTGGAKSAYAPSAPVAGASRVATSPNNPTFSPQGLGMTANSPVSPAIPGGPQALSPNPADEHLRPPPPDYRLPGGPPQGPHPLQPPPPIPGVGFSTQGGPSAPPGTPGYTSTGYLVPGQQEGPVYTPPPGSGYRDYLSEFPNTTGYEPWPDALPHPPPGVLPGTDSYYRWLQSAGIDPRSPLNYQIHEQMFYEMMGQPQNPQEMFPEFSDPWAFTEAMQGYLGDQGLGIGDTPGTFDQDLYNQILGVGAEGGREAAGYITSTDASQMAGYDELNALMAQMGGNAEKYGGLVGFDPTMMQNQGLQQVEIARSAAERAMGDRLASSGMLGQGNAAYTEAPLYEGYLDARVGAMQDPLEMAYSTGAGNLSAISGGLQGLEGLALQGQMGQASAFGNLYGQGMGTGAAAGLGSAELANQAFLAQQKMAMGLPLQGYEIASLQMQYMNALLQDQYDSSVTRSQRAHGAKAQGDAAKSGATSSIIGGGLTGLGALVGSLGGPAGTAAGATVGGLAGQAIAP